MGESLDGVARSSHEAQAKITLIKLDEIALFRRAIFAVTTRDPLPKERALRSILGASVVELVVSRTQLSMGA